MLRTIKEQGEKISNVPLAARLRPRIFKDFIGHQQVVGPGTILRQAIERGEAGSLILWGPPGIGKTTLAYLIVSYMDATVERISAVAAGVKELKEAIARAREWQKLSKRTVLIVDEIHRFNKAQQDVLLPVVEEGLITLIGATTENPYFEVIKALLSRAQVVSLNALENSDIKQITNRALKELHPMRLTLNSNAMAAIIKISGGDARRTLNVIERIATARKQENKSHITSPGEIFAAAQQTSIQYDKKGDVHYDTISAFIKSLRGSDPDAALFYLFRMLLAGEDPKFIIRRMLIFASEDIGNADPHALMLVSAAAHTLEWVGLPEAEFAISHAAVYLASAPKSNSIYQAKEAAKADVRDHGNARPPDHIVNAPIQDMKKHGRGVDYKYPHDFPGHLVKQQYRPSVIQNHIYYVPGAEGFEKEVKRRVENARRILYGN